MRTKQLDEKIIVRMFPTDIKMIDAFIKKYPDNWPNRAAFIRAAIHRQERHLIKEGYDVKRRGQREIL